MHLLNVQIWTNITLANEQKHGPPSCHLHHVENYVVNVLGSRIPAGQCTAPAFHAYGAFTFCYLSHISNSRPLAIQMQCLQEVHSI